MPSSEQFYLAILGSFVCLLGFLRWPRSTFDLSRPRFIVPLIIWMATFYQVFWRYFSGHGRLTSSIGQFRQQLGAQAEIYIIVCMLAFWFGYALFHLDNLADRLSRSSRIRLSDETKLLTWSFWLAIIVGASMLLIVGPKNLWWNTGTTAGYGGAWLRFSSLAAVLAIFRRYIDILLVVASAALLGLGWPAKGRCDGGHYFLGGLILMMDSIPYAAGFSRGTGLPVVVAVAVYAYKCRRIPWGAVVLGAIWTIVVMNVALAGRGVFGHNAGLYPWGMQLASTTGDILGGDFSQMMRTVNGLVDALTPTSVCMAGIRAGHTLGRLSTIDWLIFQIPFPHFLVHPVSYTIDPTRFLGGTGSWGYTASAFGETWIEFQWLGAFAFMFMGMVYRFIDRLAGTEANQAGGTAGLFVLMLPISYIAMYLGMFNNFRSWWALAVFGFYVLFGVVYLGSQIARHSSGFADHAELV